MIGYLRGADAERRPFQDLLVQLRAATMGASGTPVARRYHLFGRAVQPLDPARADSLVQEATYQCAEADRARCNNQESRLDLVLRRAAAASPDTLSVIVTDLWLSAAELEASGPVAVGAPAAELLAAGRAVGVLGVRAPYKGAIYDLPSGGEAPWAGDRPLFVLLAGPLERVAAFRDSLARAGVRGFGPEEARFSLFTAERLQGRGGGELEIAGAALARRPVLPPRSGVDVPQAVLSTKAGLRERLGRGAESAVRFTADPAAAARPGAVWQGPTQGAVKAWRLKGGQPCRPGAWAPLADLQGGWSGEGSGPRRFSLSAADLAARLPKGGTYLLAGELRRTGLQTPSPANAWMRAWSFNASTEPAVLAAPPAVFPTLNLSETAQILEAAADDAARRRPVALTGFTAVIRSED